MVSKICRISKVRQVYLGKDVEIQYFWKMCKSKVHIQFSLFIVKLSENSMNSQQNQFD